MARLPTDSDRITRSARRVHYTSPLLPHVTRVLSRLGLDVRSAVQAGNVCVLPAYPEVDGERGLPVPIPLFAPKGLENPLQGEHRQRVVNRLLQPEPADGVQLKQMREGYISAQPTKVYKPPIVVRTHNTVEDQQQRPTETVGGVYTYEAIAAQDHRCPIVLRSELRIRKSLATLAGTDWWKRLNGEVSLGRSKKDDYGSVHLDAKSPVEWNGLPSSTGSDLFVWLVSDTLLRNPRLRSEPTAACLGDELSRLLGVTLRLRTSSDGRLDDLVRTRRLDTWHVGWGLPRPSLVALQAGSCAVFQVDGTIDPQRLAQLEASGIGERTAEGYGQVRFNHRLLTSLPKEWPNISQMTRENNTSTASKGLPEMDKDTVYFARLIERECWKREIRRACLAVAADGNRRQELLGWTAEGGQGKPPMSQLGGLRGQLALLRSRNDRSQVLNWLDHLKDNNRRKDNWPSVDMVRDFIQSDSRIWDVIKKDDWPTITANGQSQLREELWALAVRTFFDACIRAHKRELESEQQRKEPVRGT